MALSEDPVWEKLTPHLRSVKAGRAGARISCLLPSSYLLGDHGNIDGHVDPLWAQAT